MTNWQRLPDYTIPGAETMPGEAAQQLLFAGEVAMTSATFTILRRAKRWVRTWAWSRFRITAPRPLKSGGIGGAGTALIVSNYSEVKEQAVNFIKHLMSKEEQELKAASGEGSLLNVTDVDTSQYYTDPFKQIQQVGRMSPAPSSGSTISTHPI